MIQEILWIFLLVFLPGLELRLAIPIAILGSKFTIPILNYTYNFQPLNPILVLIIAVIANFILGIIVYEVLYKIINYFKEKNRTLKKIYEKFILKLQKKNEKLIEKYGWLGIAIFIAIPLPGSGVYSGAFLSQILGIKRKHYYIASFIGVLIAGIIVTLLTITGRMIV